MRWCGGEYDDVRQDRCDLSCQSEQETNARDDDGLPHAWNLIMMYSLPTPQNTRTRLQSHRPERNQSFACSLCAASQHRSFDACSSRCLPLIRYQYLLLTTSPSTTEPQSGEQTTKKCITPTLTLVEYLNRRRMYLAGVTMFMVYQSY